MPNTKLQKFMYIIIFSVLTFQNKGTTYTIWLNSWMILGIAILLLFILCRNFIAFDVISVTLSCVDMVYMRRESRSVSTATTSTETHIPL